MREDPELDNRICQSFVKQSFKLICSNQPLNKDHRVYQVSDRAQCSCHIPPQTLRNATLFLPDKIENLNIEDIKGKCYLRVPSIHSTSSRSGLCFFGLFILFVFLAFCICNQKARCQQNKKQDLKL